MAEQTQAPPTPIKAFRCQHCAKVLGQIVNGVLREGQGNLSNFPVIRRCPECGKRNVKLAA